MTVSEETIETVMDLVRPALQQGNHRRAVGYLLEAINDCKNADAARAAQILLNDYLYLKDEGCHPYVAMMITLTHPEDLS